MRRIILYISFAFALLTSAQQASAQNIAVNTDAVMDMAGAPSIGVEMTISKRATMGINAAYSPNLLWKAGHAFIVQPEYRFYFSGRPMYRHFIGLVGMYTDYNLHFNGKHYNGNAGGLGVSFGYVWNVKERLFIDFHSSLGAAFFHQKEWGANTNYIDQSVSELGYVPANAHGTLCIPMRIGISLAYVMK